MANSDNKKSAFEVLNAINVNEHTESKNAGGTNLTYLSWVWAWSEVKKAYPDAVYEIEKFNGIPYAYDPLTGYMVYTRVTIEGITHEMWLPVMDGNNKAMKAQPYEYSVKNKNFQYAKWDAQRNGYYDRYGNEQKEFITKKVEAATMFDVNKTIMRCLVKNLAMFGLGLYIYAGEDLPDTTPEPSPAPAKKAPAKKAAAKNAPAPEQIICQRCGKPIQAFNGNTPQQVANATMKSFGKVMCMACGSATKQEQEAQAQMVTDEELQLPFPIEE